MNEPTNISNNTEIDQALKEFETKSVADGSYRAVKYYNETDTPKIIKLVMKWSGFKEQKQAEYVLLGFVIVAIAVSLFLVFGGGKSQIPFLPPPTAAFPPVSSQEGKP